MVPLSCISIFKPYKHILNNFYKINCFSRRPFTKISSFNSITSNELINYPRTQITTLPNGLRIASENNPANQTTATIGVWISAGSRFENSKNNGSAHFLEHLAFKGTTNRSQENLEMEIENIGGHLNAYTSREQTTYFSQVMKNDIPQAIDILSDILLNSKLSKDSVEKERSVIIREMSEVYKDQEELVFDHLHEAAYPENPLGQTILGPKENINSITREDLLNYINTFYTADKMVISAAGCVDHKMLVELVKEKFSGVSKKPVNPPQVVPSKYTGGEYKERQDSMDLAHVALSHETCGWTDPDTFPLLVIHALIGSWDKNTPNGEHSSSGLISKIAGLKYGEKVMAFNTLYQDTGLFGVYFSSYEKRLLDMVHAVWYSMGNIIVNTEQENVDYVKTAIATNAFLGLFSSSQTCEDIGRQILTYGRRMHPTEFIERLNYVDKQAVVKAARRFFHNKDHTMSAIGPILELPGYDFFRRRTAKLTM